MSLSNPRGTTSPVQRTFELRLSKGDVTYYDRDAKKTVSVTESCGEWEEGKEVALSTPFKFIILDILSMVGGFNNKTSSGIWSNEVRSIKDEKLVVRTRNGVLAEGLYADIKDEICSTKVGAKFGNSVYLAYKDGELTLGNLKLLGAGVKAFFDFRKGKRFDAEPGVAITGWKAEKTGTNTYFVPKFETVPVSEETLAEAVRLDEQLQEFLSDAPKRQEPERESEPTVDDSWTEEPPF